MAIPTAFRPLGGSKKQILPGYTVFPKGDFSFTWSERPAETGDGPTWPDLVWDNLTLENIKTCFELIGVLDTAKVTATANYAFNRQGDANTDNQVAIAQLEALPALAITGRGRLGRDSFFVAKIFGRYLDVASGWDAVSEGKTLKVELQYERSNTSTDTWVGVYAYGPDMLVQLSAIRGAVGSVNDLRKDGPVTLEIPAETLAPTADTCDGVIVFIRDASLGNTTYFTRIRVWFE